MNQTRRFNDAKEYREIGLFIFTEQVVRLYTEDENVLELAKTSLLYAIFFQLSDAIAAPIQGTLRGYKDVKVTFIMAVISYWAVGLPLGYVLAHCSLLDRIDCRFSFWCYLLVDTFDPCGT